MNGRGFIFSLDAFVAFVLIMITINLMIFTIGTPKPYHAELEAAHILAHDTLRVLATSGDSLPGTEQTYLERILANEGDTVAINDIMVRVAGGSSARSIIPRGYGYRLEYLNVDAPGGENWVALYDAGTDGCAFGSDRCGKNFTKLQASETTLLAGYDPLPAPGESPFCHAGCQGYISPGVYAPTCNTTPCDTVNSNFLAGSNSLRIVRLVVYT
jgi:hypothetical protein